MPKRNTNPSASHKYSCHFLIIDPTIPHPSQAISVLWFFNEIQDFYYQFRVGDILICRQMKYQTYNEAPQLTGNTFKKARLIIIHNKMNYNCLMNPIILHGSNEYLQHILSSHKTLLQLNDDKFWPIDEWEIYDLVSHTPPKPFTSLSFSRFCLNLYIWGQHLFRNETLSDSKIHHTTLHHMLYQLNMSKNIMNYAQLLPPGNSISGEDTAVMINPKHDMICFILNIILPPENITNTTNNPQPIRLVVWDGTSSGSSFINETNLAYFQEIIQALYIAHAWSESPDLPNFSLTIEDILHNLPKPHNLLGVPLILESSQGIANNLLMKLKPGTWIKLRNVQIQNTTPEEDQSIMSEASLSFGVKYLNKLYIAQDTHVVELAPYFKDIKTLIMNYWERLKQIASMSLPPPELNNSTNGSNKNNIQSETSGTIPTSSSVSTTAQMSSTTVGQRPIRRNVNAKGIPYSSLVSYIL